MEWRVVAITQWPGDLTEERLEHRFRKAKGTHSWNGHAATVHGIDWAKTMDLLDREIYQLDGDNVVLQMAVEDRDIRQDGWIRANARPSHPGVILTFDSCFGPLSYPTDTFTDWQANVRAIALSLEALRKVDRYGVTKRGEQYTGFKRLAAKIDGGPHAVLAEHSGWTEDEVRDDPRAAYLKAAKSSHPDRGGSATAFSQVGDAARLIGVGQ